MTSGTRNEESDDLLDGLLDDTSLFIEHGISSERIDALFQADPGVRESDPEADRRAALLELVADIK
jgi:hypothetical protein